MIELQQGWLYDYFIFIDDDADWGKGNLTSFEERLREYEPAIGSPGSYSFPNDPVESNIRIDPIFIAYHREALEVLHPFILDFDPQCGWSSQFLQDMEVSLGYRNHALTFKGMYIYNGLHRPYKRGCDYQALIDSTRAVLPSTLRHCAVTEERDASVKNGLYFQGRKVGKPHKKRGKVREVLKEDGGGGEKASEASGEGEVVTMKRKKEKEIEVEYHYLSHYPEVERGVVGGSWKPFFNSYYALFNQSGVCSDVTKFTLEDENCCTVDILPAPLPLPSRRY